MGMENYHGDELEIEFEENRLRELKEDEEADNYYDDEEIINGKYS